MPQEETKKWNRRDDGRRNTSTDNMLVSRAATESGWQSRPYWGAMPLDKEAIVTAEDMLRSDDFYRDADGIIFEAIFKSGKKQ